MRFTFQISYVILGRVPSTVIFWTERSSCRKSYSNKATLLLGWSYHYKKKVAPRLKLSLQKFYVRHKKTGWPLRHIYFSNDNEYFLFDVALLHCSVMRRLSDLAMSNMVGINPREHLGSPPVFVFILFFGFILYIFCALIFALFVFVLCIVPNVSCVSEWSFCDCLIQFSYYFFYYLKYLVSPHRGSSRRLTALNVGILTVVSNVRNYTNKHKTYHIVDEHLFARCRTIERSVPYQRYLKCRQINRFCIISFLIVILILKYIVYCISYYFVNVVDHKNVDTYFDPPYFSACPKQGLGSNFNVMCRGLFYVFMSWRRRWLLVLVLIDWFIYCV